MVSQRGMVSCGHLNSNLPPGRSSTSAFPATVQQPFPNYREGNTASFCLRRPHFTITWTAAQLCSWKWHLQGTKTHETSEAVYKRNEKAVRASLSCWQQVVREALPPCVSVHEALSRDKKKKWGWGEYSYSRKNIQGRKLRMEAVHI